MPPKYLAVAFRYLREPDGFSGFRGQTVVILQVYGGKSPPKAFASPYHAPVGPPDIEVLDKYTNLTTRRAADIAFQRLADKHIHQQARSF